MELRVQVPTPLHDEKERCLTPITMALIGAALAGGGALAAGSGKRPRQGISAQDEEFLRQQAGRNSQLEALLSEIDPAFGITSGEIEKRRGLIQAGATRTRADVFDAIQANAARMGVSGAPGFVG